MTERSEGALLATWLAQGAESDRWAARFAALAETLPCGVTLLTARGPVYANPALESLLGVPPAGLLRALGTELIRDAESRARVRAALAGAWEGRAADIAGAAAVRPDGEPLTLALSVRPLPRETEPTLLLVLSAAPRGSVERAAPRDPLRALGLHLTGLAHDLQAPLTAFLEHLGDLEARRDLPADLRESFGLYQRVTTETLGRLCRVLEWGRPSPLFEWVDLREVIRRAVAAVEAAGWPPEAQVELALSTAPAVLGHPDQLQLLVEHVLRNAAEALAPGGGIVRVSLGSVGERVTLIVADDGPGIPASLLPNVFEPFASTKGIAGGVGLGLAIVRDIALRHGGEVAIDSDRAGTVFTLRLSAARATGDPAGASPDRRRVLVVDDNDYVRETYRALLGAAGWDVSCAADADEALALAASREVDALLVDVQMPGRDGLAVVEALALWHPRLLPRVVLHTGYADEERVRQAAERHDLALLQKPCPKDRLLATLAGRAARAV